MWASTLCPFSSSTRNMAFGSGSTTVPSTRIVSSLGLARTAHHLLRWGAPEARKTAGKPKDESISPREGEHLGPVVGDRDRVLEVRRAAAVPGDDGPPVVEDLGLGPPGVDHGL